jgi:Transposase DDE domain
MERERWLRMVRTVEKVVPVPLGRRYSISWRTIVLVHLWAAHKHRPAYWACDPANWPEEFRPERLPDNSTFSRRKNKPLFDELLGRLERHQKRGRPRGLLHIFDGKPLPVGPHTHDCAATRGRGAGRSERGYKMHSLLGKNRRVEAWEVHPLNVDERIVARRMVRSLRGGYLLADAFLDDSQLHAICAAHGVQLVAPRRRPGTGLGHHPQQPARLRSIDLLEHSATGFGPLLLHQRGDIERYFGALSSAHYGIGPLPAWVRGLQRVRRWVAAKLILFENAKNSKNRCA